MSTLGFSNYLLSLWIISLHFLLCAINVSDASCQFPDFLRKHPDGSSRYWLTELYYNNGTNQVRSYIKLIVTSHEIKAHRYIIRRCEGHRENACQTVEPLYKQTCHKMVEGRYKVHHKDNSDDQHSHESRCIEFDQKNQNIVLIRESERRGPDICKDWNLKRSDWPWLAPNPVEWSHCPLEGGYDFRLREEQKERDREFRPNRLESECILGEGMVINYNSPSSSPFYTRNLSMSLMCWGSWDEDGYKFTIAGQSASYPQFSLRTPVSLNTSHSRADMYLSPVAPLYGRYGVINVQNYVLKIWRSEPGLCYDESDQCSSPAYKNRCMHNGLNEIGNFCKKTCSLCAFSPKNTAECHFGDEIQGQWIIFEKNRKEILQVPRERGFLDFSDLGKFLCKSIQWNRNGYKLFSYYQNGCRPRYTCMRMQTLLDDSRRAEFQLSRSSLTDQSFQMCDNFQDDPPPINAAVRSKEPKLLIRLNDKDRPRSNTCGIGGSINVTMTKGRAVCHGTVSDRDPRRCGSEAKLTVDLRGPCSVTDPSTQRYHAEFFCDSYITIEDDFSILITKSIQGPETYSCWIIRTYPESMDYRPWRDIYLLDRAQCGWPRDIINTDRLKAEAKLILNAPTDKRDLPCHQEVFTGKPPDPYRFTDHPKVPLTSGWPPVKDKLYGGATSMNSLALHWIRTVLVVTIVILNT